MPWPPQAASGRVALVIYGLTLLLYTTVSGMLIVAGVGPRPTVIVAQLIALLGLMTWLARLMKIPMREAFALRPAAPVHWYMVAAAAIPLQAAGGAIQFAIVSRLPEDSFWRRTMEEVVGEFVRAESGLDLAMLFLAAVVTAAICEEVVFRGLLLQLLQRRSGWISAIAVSAVLFAVFHLNPIVLLPVALVGSYLAVLVWRSGSLYPAIVAHALNNGLALFALPRVFDEATYSRWLWPIMIGSTVLFGVVLRIYLGATQPSGPAWRPLRFEVAIDGGLGDGEQAEHADQAEQ